MVIEQGDGPRVHVFEAPSGRLLSAQAVKPLGNDAPVWWSPDARWLLNNEPVPSARGCLDIDLNFSPSTNLLPVRRLNLTVGHEATVRAAWLRRPDDTSYRRCEAWLRSAGRGADGLHEGSA